MRRQRLKPAGVCALGLNRGTLAEIGRMLAARSQDVEAGETWPSARSRSSTVASPRAAGELRDMADDVIRTRTAEIDRMRTWLKKWYGRTVDDEHVGHHEDIQLLEEASGPELGVRFMVRTSFHQPQAIERAREVRRFPLMPLNAVISTRFPASGLASRHV